MSEKISLQDEVSAAEGGVFEEIELELRFEVGATRMTAGEFAALQPGYVFMLETPTDKPATILANGVAVGRGRLVQSDGRVGVQLLEMRRHGP